MTVTDVTTGTEMTASGGTIEETIDGLVKEITATTTVIAVATRRTATVVMIIGNQETTAEGGNKNRETLQTNAVLQPLPMPSHYHNEDEKHLVGM
ncbi:hypothetical protein FRC20_004170 [Serendipita sp. 405]|nr:hypothetical protein FRC20_004170 [Serendipita sp. 405]